MLPYIAYMDPMGLGGGSINPSYAVKSPELSRLSNCAQKRPIAQSQVRTATCWSNSKETVMPVFTRTAGTG